MFYCKIQYESIRNQLVGINNFFKTLTANTASGSNVRSPLVPGITLRFPCSLKKIYHLFLDQSYTSAFLSILSDDYILSYNCNYFDKTQLYYYDYYYYYFGNVMATNLL